MTTRCPRAAADLTDQEREADLDLDQLKQLVGLVEYDETNDVFPVTGWDAIVFVVGNATQTAHYYQSAWGMELVAYSRPRERQPRPQVLRAQVRLDPLRHQRRRRPRQPARRPPPPARRRRRRHRARGARRRPVHRPGPAGPARRVLEEPHDLTDEHGTVRTAAIATYGETRHTLVAPRVDGQTYAGPYLPGYVAARVDLRQARGPAEAALPGPRPHRRQRRARPDGRVGRASTTGSWAS